MQITKMSSTFHKFAGLARVKHFEEGVGFKLHLIRFPERKHMSCLMCSGSQNLLAWWI